MKREQVLGVIRHVLTFLGGIGVMKGFATESMVEEIVGAILTLIGGAWSIAIKQDQ